MIRLSMRQTSEQGLNIKPSEAVAIALLAADMIFAGFMAVNTHPDSPQSFKEPTKPGLPQFTNTETNQYHDASSNLSLSKQAGRIVVRQLAER
jgi:hypothetical protein